MLSIDTKTRGASENLLRKFAELLTSLRLNTDTGPPDTKTEIHLPDAVSG